MLKTRVNSVSSVDGRLAFAVVNYCEFTTLPEMYKKKTVEQGLKVLDASDRFDFPLMIKLWRTISRLQ